MITNQFLKTFNQNVLILSVFLYAIPIYCQESYNWLDLANMDWQHDRAHPPHRTNNLYDYYYQSGRGPQGQEIRTTIHLENFKITPILSQADLLYCQEFYDTSYTRIKTSGYIRLVYIPKVLGYRWQSVMIWHYFNENLTLKPREFFRPDVADTSYTLKQLLDIESYDGNDNILRHYYLDCRTPKEEHDAVQIDYSKTKFTPIIDHADLVYCEEFHDDTFQHIKSSGYLRLVYFPKKGYGWRKDMIWEYYDTTSKFEKYIYHY